MNKSFLLFLVLAVIAMSNVMFVAANCDENDCDGDGDGSGKLIDLGLCLDVL